MKRICLLLICISLIGCKTTKTAVAATTPETPKSIPSDSFVDAFYEGRNDFKTVAIKASAKYVDEHQDQSVTADVRIKKDEIIFLSIRFLGITMAKAIITPQEVRYYEKINETFFEGDYATLSKWLGTDLDFQRVQNLLLGEPIENLKGKKVKQTSDGTSIRIDDTSDKQIPKAYTFDASNLKKSEVKQPAENRNLEVNYPAYATQQGRNFPAQILIEALHPKGKTNIRINYNSATFNEELSYPYSVPDGYERVFIE
ncbi:DUF4292 domain-containing protein [Flavobacterium silvaticum]|uniref:DUF4292 domain-containing protein n=1 Tax=Flavobacterium silvaticum TaxID=1852020 RepID=A0A972FME8_9FLAO|nr:DUF4292 domain-containing protein [Flavobacterium silvaticum]NMH28352.1 DUF4292 domain-containing protein [Flavobacterium silvaticum]